MSPAAVPPTPILHHYKESPYAEKVRTLLGYKRLAWHSVEVPRIAPKPDLTALTGGYRKVPVLQIGADVYCDTRLIAEVIDRLAPAPSLKPSPGSMGLVLENWVDQVLFGKAVGLMFGRHADVLPDALLADRAALRGAPLDRAPLKAGVPMVEQELTLHLAWLEQALADDRPFFNGAHPDACEFTLYSTLWFARAGQLDFNAFPRVATWMGRMAGFGKGDPMPMSAEAALDIARDASPEPVSAAQLPDGSGLRPGQRVRVTPESLGHGTSVEGDLLTLSPLHLSLRHHSERCGTVHIHFPRLGYRLQLA